MRKIGIKRKILSQAASKLYICPLNFYSMNSLPAKILTFTGIIIGSIFYNHSAQGQQYLWDIGIKSGIANYFGDLEQDPGTNSFNLYRPNTRWATGFFARKRLGYSMAMRFDLSYLRLSGADSLNPASGRTTRNLHFRNDVVEASWRMEFYPLVIDDVGWKRRFLVDFHLMGFIGAGVFWNNPQAQFEGEWHNLRPLRTEGKSYSPVQASIPMGVGFFFTFTDGRSRIRRHRIGFEVSYRMLFTDYLDDASDSYPAVEEVPEGLARDLYARTWELNNPNTPQSERRYPRKGGIRGNPDDNDAFAAITLSYSYILRTHLNGRYRPKYNYIYGNSIRSKRKKRW